VQDAKYLRAQAQVYLELAQLMSLDADAAQFRAHATDLLARADKLDHQKPMPPTL
jgi:hypothetical protein